MRDALVQIVLRLRDDALKDREGSRNQSDGVDPYYSGNTGVSMPSALPSIPPVAPLGYDKRTDGGSGLGLLSSNSTYGYGSLPVRHHLCNKSVFIYLSIYLCVYVCVCVLVDVYVYVLCQPGVLQTLPKVEICWWTYLENEPLNKFDQLPQIVDDYWEVV